MGINILLRTELDVSLFRRHFFHMIKYTEIDEIIICSGYIQEQLWNYLILDDDLLNIFKNHSNINNIVVKTVAGQFSKTNNGRVNKWETAYNKFVTKMKNNGINIAPYITMSKNWHAKIVIIRKNNIPIGSLIGSSNLTRPAYDEDHSRFNYECDVFNMERKDRL